MAETKHQLPQFTRDAEVKAESFNADDNTIEIVWTTGAAVRRYSWLADEEFDEVLSLDPGAVRLERLNLGAPFLDTHCSYSLDNVIGSIVPETAEIKDGRGVARVKLSKASGVADTVQKITEGVIRNVSVGYWIHKVIKTEATDGTVARWDIVDWEPLEISAVPIPADPGSQIRSETAPQDGAGPAMRSCIFVTSEPPARGPKPPATKETRMATTAPKKKTVAQRLADAEVEAKRLAALLAQREAEDKKDDEDDKDERDDDSADDTRDGDDEKKDGDDEADDERDGDDDTADEKKKDDERSARMAVKRDRERSAAILARAEQASSKIGSKEAKRLAEKHIAKGTSVRGFGELLLERLLAKQDKDEPTRGVTGAREMGEERSSTAPNKEQRDIEDGATHWRKVLGKKAA